MFGDPVPTFGPFQLFATSARPERLRAIFSAFGPWQAIKASTNGAK
jgi:hypothetical protein